MSTFKPIALLFDTLLAIIFRNLNLKVLYTYNVLFRLAGGDAAKSVNS